MIAKPLDIVLPSTNELPCSDDIPVDNEEQNLLPNLLLFLINSLWDDRQDWFFGVDMAVYHTTGVNPRVPIVPDAFLSLGVERLKASQNGQGRSSYAVWEEDNIVPCWVLEMVSATPGGEYDTKMKSYAKLGILYYIIYNPNFWERDRHQPFEIYKLKSGRYEQQIGEPYWMPEIGLGIGRFHSRVAGAQREILTWFEEKGDRHLTIEEREVQARKKAEQRAEQLEDYLRSKGIDPNTL